jgi:hypothetical protein
MPRRRTELALRARRAWVWRVDAEWRWQRALRLLLSVRSSMERFVGRDATLGGKRCNWLFLKH